MPAESNRSKHIQILLLTVLSIVQSCTEYKPTYKGASEKKVSQSSEAVRESGAEVRVPASEGPESIESKNAVAPSSPITLNLRFQQSRGDASFKNCLAIAVNSGNRFDLGCNHEGDLTKELSVPALSKPSVNSIRLFFSTNGNQRGTTEDKSANSLIQVEKVDSKTFKIGYEDSGDGDYNDYIFSVSTPDNVSLVIENCAASECRIE
jgi:hypothetical protein